MVQAMGNGMENGQLQRAILNSSGLEFRRLGLS